MAKKPSLTPRERKTVEHLANDKYQEAITSLEGLIEMTTILQDLTYYKGIGVKIPQSEINDAKAKLEKAFSVAMEANNNTTARVKKRFVVSQVEVEA